VHPEDACVSAQAWICASPFHRGPGVWRCGTPGFEVAGPLGERDLGPAGALARGLPFRLEGEGGGLQCDRDSYDPVRDQALHSKQAVLGASGGARHGQPLFFGGRGAWEEFTSPFVDHCALHFLVPPGLQVLLGASVDREQEESLRRAEPVPETRLLRRRRVRDATLGFPGEGPGFIVSLFIFRRHSGLRWRSGTRNGAGIAPENGPKQACSSPNEHMGGASDSGAQIALRPGTAKTFVRPPYLSVPADGDPEAAAATLLRSLGAASSGVPVVQKIGGTHRRSRREFPGVDFACGDLLAPSAFLLESRLKWYDLADALSVPKNVSDYDLRERIKRAAQR
jgi:hypothetical protein